MKKHILAIETSFEVCSVAIWDGVKAFDISQVTPRQHTQHILPMIDKLLSEANLSLSDLDAIAVATGPGSFTGVRIAISVAQGLAFGAGLKIVPISTLEALAFGAVEKAALKEAEVAMAIDAGMEEIYWAVYRVSLEHAEGVPIVKDLVCRRDQIPSCKSNPSSMAWMGAGSGWRLYLSEITQAMKSSPKIIIEDIVPNALWVAKLALKRRLLGGGLSPEAVLPVYLKNPFMMNA